MVVSNYDDWIVSKPHDIVIGKVVVGWLLNVPATC